MTYLIFTIAFHFAGYRGQRAWPLFQSMLCGTEDSVRACLLRIIIITNAFNITLTDSYYTNGHNLFSRCTSLSGGPERRKGGPYRQIQVHPCYVLLSRLSPLPRYRTLSDLSA